MESIFLPLPMNLLRSFWENGGESPPFALPSLLASSQLSLIFLRQTAARAMSNTNRHTARPTVTHRATGGNVTFWPEENGRERRQSLIIHSRTAKTGCTTVTAVSITIYFTTWDPWLSTVPDRTRQLASPDSLTSASWVWRSELFEETEPFLCVCIALASN